MPRYAAFLIHSLSQYPIIDVDIDGADEWVCKLCVLSI